MNNYIIILIWMNNYIKNTNEGDFYQIYRVSQKKVPSKEIILLL